MNGDDCATRFSQHADIAALRSESSHIFRFLQFETTDALHLWRRSMPGPAPVHHENPGPPLAPENPAPAAANLADADGHGGAPAIPRRTSRRISARVAAEAAAKAAAEAAAKAAAEAAAEDADDEGDGDGEEWQANVHRAAANAINPPAPPGGSRWRQVSQLIRNEYTSSFRPSLVRHLTGAVARGVTQLAWARISVIRAAAGRTVPGNIAQIAGIALEELSSTFSQVYAESLRTIHCADPAGSDEAHGALETKEPEEPDSEEAGINETNDGAGEEDEAADVHRNDGKKRATRTRHPFARWLMDSELEELTAARFVTLCGQTDVSTRAINPKAKKNCTGATRPPGGLPGGRLRTWGDVGAEIEKPEWSWLWEHAWRPLCEALRRDAKLFACAVPPSQTIRTAGLPRFPSESVGSDVAHLWHLLRHLQQETNLSHEWYRGLREQREKDKEADSEATATAAAAASAGGSESAEEPDQSPVVENGAFHRHIHLTKCLRQTVCRFQVQGAGAVLRCKACVKLFRVLSQCRRRRRRRNGRPGNGRPAIRASGAN